ncbi:MAG: DUF4339 domain-containing protein [Devosia sp.]
MQIHISRNNIQYGPYEMDRVNAGLSDGSLLPTDLAWSEGMTDWVPLAQYPGVQIVNRFPPPVRSAPSSPGPNPANTANEELKLQSTAKTLQKWYAVLFGASILILILQATAFGFELGGTIVWALTLGGAVGCRLKRTSVVNRLNQITNSRGGPSSI